MVFEQYLRFSQKQFFVLKFKDSRDNQIEFSMEKISKFSLRKLHSGQKF